MIPNDTFTQGSHLLVRRHHADILTVVCDLQNNFPQPTATAAMNFLSEQPNT
jgi:hypothetical protein